MRALRLTAIGAAALAVALAFGPAASARPAAPTGTQVAAPTNLRATSVTDTEISLAWDAPGGSGLAYELFFDDNPTPYIVPVNHFDVTLSRTLGMIPGSTHTFKVRTDAPDISEFSSPLTVSFLPGDNTPPTTPKNLRVVSVSGSTVQLAWDPSTDESDFVYQIWAGHLISIPSSSTTATLSTDPVAGPFPGPNTFTVRAEDEYQNRSGDSNPVTVNLQ